ncbi:hypothetical protein D3C87_2191520 [compost metagenome]
MARNAIDRAEQRLLDFGRKNGHDTLGKDFPRLSLGMFHHAGQGLFAGILDIG